MHLQLVRLFWEPPPICISALTEQSTWIFRQTRLFARFSPCRPANGSLETTDYIALKILTEIDNSVTISINSFSTKVTKGKTDQEVIRQK